MSISSSKVYILTNPDAISSFCAGFVLWRKGGNTRIIRRVSNVYSDDRYNRTRLRCTYKLPEVGGDFHQ